MPPDQRTDPGAVDGRHIAEVDDEMALTAPEEPLDVFFEGLRRPSGDERHLRREDQTVGGVDAMSERHCQAVRGTIHDRRVVRI
jgi:hypothetical protein